MSKQQAIYEGRLKFDGQNHEIKIVSSLKSNSSNVDYAVIVGGTEKRKLVYCPNSSLWEEKGVGVTKLSKKCAKLIDEYFD